MNQKNCNFNAPCPADVPEGDLDDFIFAVSEDTLISER